MGLTGFILEIELKLRKIETSFIKQHIIIAKPKVCSNIK